MKNIFLFPGQGAQKKGMLFELCRKNETAMKILKRAEEISGEPVSKYMWETDETALARSDRNQLAITTTSIITAEILKAEGILPEICAGFSLGEYSALYTSGVLKFEDTIMLVKQRGIIMQKVCDELSEKNTGNKPGMAAIIGLSANQISDAIAPLVNDEICFLANLNSTKQTVIAGTADGLKKAEDLCRAAGCRRFILLKVAGPFHSPLMLEAGKEFSSAIEKIKFRNPSVRLFSNVTGDEIFSGDEAKKLAVKHFTHPVRWIDEEKNIAEIIGYKSLACAKNWKIYETGPGKVLSGLWRDSEFSQNIEVTGDLYI